MKAGILVLCLMISLCLKAQFIKPGEFPKNVKTAFDSLYPNSKFPIWKNVTNCFSCASQYEGTFTDSHMRNWITIDTGGRVISIEKDIDTDSLPVASLAYIDVHYEQQLVFCKRKIIRSKNVFYFVGIRGTKLTYALLFTEDGALYKEKNNLLGIILGASVRQVFIDF